MGFYPPNMYDPQINMIRKPFVLNKEKLRQDFNSPKYANRRKEFFATFSEFLRNFIRDKYYEFMNDIQTEISFFAWYDHYFKPKLLAGRNNNSLLHKYLNIQNLPAWFLHWWDQFGPEHPILPPRRIDERTPEQLERGYSNEQIHFPFSLPQIYEKFQPPPALSKFLLTRFQTSLLSAKIQINSFRFPQDLTFQVTKTTV
jgi:hypothetical protein